MPIAARLTDDPRVRIVTPGVPGRRGRFVVYWPQMYRRATSNAALSYAIAEANERRLPLLVYEALRVDYPYASDRFHAFVLEGARGEAARYRARGAEYVFFLPRTPAEARGVVRALAAQADLLVTDDVPAFVAPRQTARVASPTSCEVVAFDDNAVVPLALFPREEYAARTLRPKVARALDAWLRPVTEPSVAVSRPTGAELLFDPFDVERADLAAALAGLPIDHAVPAVADAPGGGVEARRRLAAFVRDGLGRYVDDQSHPDRTSRSTLSPYLHFGHVSAREVALAVRDARAPAADRDGFLEQLIVRRTLSFNVARSNPDYASFDALPRWATATLAAHADDPRPRVYSRDELEAARTDDPIWNAAQRELLATGAMQNYLRMQWGKNVIAWKRTPRAAFDDLVYLNDKYALDGRDPNTYANIAWCFGKFDRAWGPERPIFGTVRYMSSASARRKLAMNDYLARWSG